MATKSVLRRLGYRVEGNIDEGAYSKVKLATSSKHPNKVAIKIMDRKRMIHLGVEKLLTQELFVLRSIRHPHIVEVLEIAETRRGKVFVVMEACKMDLAKMIESVGRIPVQQAKKWFSQLVDAIVYLHQRGFVHRDIKCRNTLLTADNQIKLADFGLARSLNSDLTDTFCGTPYCMAPEMLYGMSYNPMKSDVWSLGVLLYQMVTGIRPFRANSMIELLVRLQEPLAFPQFLKVGQRSCWDLITMMLQVNPFDRPTVMEVAQHPWLLSLRETPAAPVPAAPAPTAQEQQIEEDFQECESDVNDSENGDVGEKLGCFAGLRKIFRRKSSPPTSAEPSTAHAVCLTCEQRQVAQSPEAAPQEPTKRKGFRRLRFPLLRS